MNTRQLPYEAFVIKGQYYIWDAQVVYELRTRFRICGSFIGTLGAVAPQQNVFLGLPQLLSTEETCLGVEKGFLKLVSFSYNTTQALTTHQSELENIDQHVNVEDFSFHSKRSWMQEVIGNMFHEYVDKFKSSSAILLPTRANQTQHTLAKENIRLECDVHCTWPQSNIEKNRYEIFKEIWESGHYLGAGSKFGADYLVYPGDPYRFHANYIVNIKQYREKLLLSEIILGGRLGTNVKKEYVCCTIDPDDHKVLYFRFIWSGL